MALILGIDRFMNMFRAGARIWSHPNRVALSLTLEPHLNGKEQGKNDIGNRKIFVLGHRLS
jgi:hypothetical protein